MSEQIRSERTSYQWRKAAANAALVFLGCFLSKVPTGESFSWNWPELKHAIIVCGWITFFAELRYIYSALSKWADGGNMKLVVALFLTITLVPFMAGCNAYQSAETAYHVVDTVLNIAQADLPALGATGIFSTEEKDAVLRYLEAASFVNNEFKSCIDNAQQKVLNKKSKFLACLNILSTGLADPKNLQLLRIMRPEAQRRVQLWITAIQVGVNTAIVTLGGQGDPAPSVGTQPTTAELQNFKEQVFSYGR